MAGPKPITGPEFSHLLKRLGVSPKDGPFSVAVSGGADSMALSLLMADFAPSHFLTFDHGLRPGSKKEAGAVHAWLSDKGLGHTVLTWKGKKPQTGIEEKARLARYRALEGWCSRNNVRFLLTAHQLEDQAETFLMRLLKGSGLDGLAAMAAKTPGFFEPGVEILRPLLGVSRERLKATLKAGKHSWVEDPANENTDFTRVRVRKLLRETRTLDPALLAKTASRFGQIREVLEGATKAGLEKALKVNEAGFAALDGKKFLQIPRVIGQKMLGKILRFISQSDYPPSGEKVERLYKDMAGKNFAGATLSGCRIVPEGAGFLFCREAGKIKHRTRLAKGKKVFWDNRFEMELKGNREGLSIRPLTEKGWEKLAGTFPEVKKVAIPHPARASLPAVFRDKKVVCVPHLRFNPEKLAVSIKFAPKKAVL